jgi:hypothetical protein
MDGKDPQEKDIGIISPANSSTPEYEPDNIDVT